MAISWFFCKYFNELTVKKKKEDQYIFDFDTFMDGNALASHATWKERHQKVTSKKLKKIINKRNDNSKFASIKKRQ